MSEQAKDREPQGLLRDYRVVGARNMTRIMQNGVPFGAWAAYAHKDRMETGPYYTIWIGFDASALDRPACDYLIDDLFPDEEERLGYMETRTHVPGLLTRALEIQAGHTLCVLATDKGRITEWLYLSKDATEAAFKRLSRRKLRAAFRLARVGRFQGAAAAARYAHACDPKWEATVLAILCEQYGERKDETDFIRLAFYRCGKEAADDADVPTPLLVAMAAETVNLKEEPLFPPEAMLLALTSLVPLIRRRYRRVG